MLDLLGDIRDELKVLNYKKNMNTVSVAKKFPVDNQQQLLDFMDDSDGLFQARCNGFYECLFNVRASTKKKFKENLKNALFSPTYTEKHHWPNVL